MEQSEHNTLNLNGLSRKERNEALFFFVSSFPCHISYSQRINQTAISAGISKKSLLQLARRAGWEAKLKLIVTEQANQEAYARLLDSAAPAAPEVSNLTLAKGIKNLATIGVSTALQHVNTAKVLIDYLAGRINGAVAGAGGVAYMEETTANQVRIWQRQLTSQVKSIQEYIKPTALQALLNLTRFTESLPTDTDTPDSAAFTSEALQRKLQSMGMLSAFQNPAKAIEGYGPLPNIADPAYGTAPTAPPTKE